MAKINPTDAYPDDFLEQILAIPPYQSLAGNDSGSSSETACQLGSAGAGGLHRPPFPLGLSLDNGHVRGGAFPVHDGDCMNLSNSFPAFEHFQARPFVTPASQLHHQAFQGQPNSVVPITAPHPPPTRTRIRARRGQATDPHSIAERLRRERITERIKALQELVPSCNKTDRAAMLDEILDYVKFLRLQVKVLSMSRLGGAGAVAQLVANVPLQLVEGPAMDNGCSIQQVWEKWSDEEVEQQVVKLMHEDVGAAMQFLQSKALCIMPISLAALIYPAHPSDPSTLIRSEPPPPS